MKLLKAHVENFGSYRTLDFDFSGQGLTLVYGPTGSGKSTLQDISTWILYGVTSKNGAVEDIRSWFSLDSKTLGTLDVELPDGMIKVTRTRGKTHENDLYWTEESNPEKLERGKDLKDTQTRLEERLGISADLYCTASTFNEFSDAASFFLAKAKDKRAVLEKVTNLSLPIKLAERASNAKKELKRELENLGAAYSRATGGHDKLMSTLPAVLNRFDEWERTQINRIKGFEEKAKNFEQEKEEKVLRLAQSILALKPVAKGPTTCQSCGTVLEAGTTYFNEARKQELEQRIKEIKESANTYMDQAYYERERPNPYGEQAEQLKLDISEVEAEKQRLKQALDELNHKASSLDQLQDLSHSLRSVLLQNVVEIIQNNTNGYLERYFDSEIRVELNLPDFETLDVLIQKNGYLAVYKQLSKGQRQMLRLCFSIAIMEASANNAGVSLGTLLFDESLDGLDTALKLKAFDLFSELEKSHESVLVIDHSEELKEMFSNKYEIKLVEDQSEVIHASSI